LSVRIQNPYLGDGAPWLRGNLHAHSTNSDGMRPPAEVAAAYAALGYDFLMISDHDYITQPGSIEINDLTLIPGYEVTADGPHILHVNAGGRIEPAANRQEVLDAVAAQGGGITIVCHPNRDRLYAHCPQEFLERWKGYTGVEIYNGVTRRSEGLPCATERWDRLLGLGRKVWGFANDDSHLAADDGVAWNMVQAASRSREDIVHALRTGSFYASTGVIVKTISVEGNRIQIETENAERIVASCDFGRRVATVDGPTMQLTVPENPPISYLRFECYGFGDAMAWLQPMFLGA